MPTNNPYMALAEEDISGRLPVNEFSSSNPYMDIVEEDKANINSGIQQSLKVAGDTTPQVAGEIQRLSKKTDMPAEAVKFEMDTARTRARQIEAQALKLTTYSPILARQLTDVSFAEIAQNSLPELSQIEKIIKWFSDIPSDIAIGTREGILQNQQGNLKYKMMAGIATPEDVARVDEIETQLKGMKGTDGAWEKFSKTVGQNLDTAPEAIKTGLQFATVTGAATALSPAFAGAPAAAALGFGAGVLHTMLYNTYRVEGGEVYEKLLKEGVPHKSAQWAGLGVGVVNAALEGAGLEVASVALAPAKKILAGLVTKKLAESLTVPTLGLAVKEYAKGHALHMAGEVLTETAQEISAIVGEDLARAFGADNIPTKISTIEGREEIANRITSVIVDTAQAMMIGGAIGPSGTFAFRAYQMNQAKKQTEFLEAVTGIASNSEVRKLNPDKYEEFAHAQTVNTPAENVYIDGQTFANTLRQLGVTADEVSAIVPDIKQQLDDALKTEGDVIIPTSKYMAHIAGTELGNGLMQHMRLDPEGLSMAEHKVMEQSKKDMMSEAQSIIAEKDKVDQTFSKSANQVERTMFDQLVATNMPASNARANAQIVRDMYVVAAAKMDVMPHELYEQVPYHVRAGITEQAGANQAQMFDQAGNIRTDSAAFKSWFREGKIVDQQGKPIVVYHGTTKNVSEFQPSQGVNGQIWGAGYYLTRDPKYANSFAKDYTKSIKEEDEGGNVMPLYVALQNPLTDAKELTDIKSEVGSNPDAITAEVKSRGYDGIDVNIGGRNIIVAFNANDIKSVNNQGQWSGETNDLLSQRAKTEQETGKVVPATVDAVSSVQSSFDFASGQSFKTNRDFKLAIQERVLQAAKEAKVDLSNFTKNVEQYLVRMAIADTMTALESNQNAIGWYNEKVTKALRLVSLIHPEIATDPQAKFAFTWALAVTSNGQKVNSNFQLAEEAYSSYKKNGVMPTNIGAGTAQIAINSGLKLYNDLIKQHGFEVVEKFMTTKTTVKNVEAFTGRKVSGENLTTEVYGAAALGPKIGNGFFANLYGHFEQLTMDRWFVRTWGRWTGTLIENKIENVKQKSNQYRELIKALTPKEKKAFEDIIGMKMNSKNAAQVAVAIKKASMKPINRQKMTAIAGLNEDNSAIVDKALGPARANVERISVGDEMRKIGNSLAGYLDGQKEMPDGPPERGRMRKVLGQALTELQKTHPDLTMSDLQAILWYPEKRLYDAAKVSETEEAQTGYEDNEAPDYANAAADLAREKGIAQSEIDRVIKEVDDELQLAANERAAGTGRDSGNGILRQSAVREERGTVIFEVAPDPNNKQLSDRWNALTGEQRHTISDNVARKIIPAVLDAANASGQVLNQIGSYQADTNPSFAIRLETGNPMTVAKALGFVLSQDSMMAISADGFEGSFDAGAIRIKIGEKSEFDIDQIYQTLRDIEGFPQINGQTTSNGMMTILLDEGVDRVGMANAIDQALNGQYAVEHTTIFAAFPEKQDYDYGSERDDQAGNEGLARGRYRDARAEASTLLDRAISGIEAGGSIAAEQPVGTTGQLGQQARGGFDPKSLTTLLYEKADFSTFMHETFHFGLEFYVRLAQMEGGAQVIKNDLDTVFQWMGIAGETPEARLQTWLGMSIDEQRKHHEAFAYNGEIYLFEGKAPSIKLQDVFNKFFDFMRRIYVSIRDDLNALYKQENGTDLPIMTEEIRGVMDRMLASENQIRQAETVRNMVPIFQTQEQSGMDANTWAAYQVMAKEAHDQSVQDMTTASLRQMRWLSNAKSRVLKEMQREVEAQRKEMRDIVATEVQSQPVYQADQFIRRGELILSDEATKEQRRFATETGMGSTKLSMVALKEMYGEEGNAIWRNLPTGKYGLMAQEGLHPDLVANQFGFTSGDEMIRALLAAAPLKEAIDQATDQRMLETYGEMQTQKQVDIAIERALHNEARSRFAAIELKALAKAVAPVRVMVLAAKQVALGILENKKILEIKPNQYSASEAKALRAAAAAMKKVDTATAIKALQSRLLNNQLATEALKTNQEIAKALEFLKGTQTPAAKKRIGADNSDQIQALLSRFGLAPKPQESALGNVSLAEWMKKQEEERGKVPDIAPELLIETHAVPYNELTVREFRDLADAIKQIAYMGREEQKLLTAEKATTFKEARDQIVASINENASGNKLDIRSPATAIERLKQGAKRFGFSQIKAASVAHVLDGGKWDGPMWEFFIRSANNAGNKETTMRSEATRALSEILDPVFKSGKLHGSGTYFPSIDRSLNREQIFSIALNMGNEGNMQRLLGGEGWTIEQVMPVIQTLTAADLNAVQKIWDHIGSYKPQIAEKERRLYGKEPKWVDPQPIQIQSADGTIVDLKGGYYPVKYDPLASLGGEQMYNADDAKRELQAAFTSATTKRSFTKERVNEVLGRPLLYSLSTVYSGINDVIHDLAWHEWLIDANRLLRSSSIDKAIRENYGPDYKSILTKWVKDNAAGERYMQNNAEIALGFLRKNISAAGLGLNLMNAIQQITGFTQTIPIIGAGYTARGISWTLSENNAYKQVADMSEFMANRARTQFRELNEIRNKVEGKSGVMTAIHENLYFLAAQMQLMVDVPTWRGAFEKAIDEGHDEKRAIALADQVVIDSQGSGMLKDMSEIQRGSAAVKLFTVFGDFQNVLLNIAFTKTKSEKSAGKLMADYLMLYTVPMLLTYAIKSMLTPKESGSDDPSKLAKELAAEQISYLMGSVMIVRELADAAKMMVGGEVRGRDYGGPAGLRLISNLYRLRTQVQQGVIDDAFRKAAVDTIGTMMGLPSAQINRSITGYVALKEGRTKNPAALLFGFEKHK